MATIKSIEEKAKRYDEALEMAKKLIENEETNVPVFYVNNIKDIFPELKESEDERIKKVIKQVLSESTTEKDECYLDNGVTQQEVFAWLEAQGEQPKKHDVCDNCDQQGCCVSPCPMKLVEKQGEQKPAWSEEDEKRLSNAITQLKAASLIIVGDEIDDSITFIKSLKDRVRPKQEWNEEDYNEIETIACHLDNINNKGMAEVLRNIRDKYYHIIPQNRWKPRDLPHWKKSTLPNDNTTGFNSDYFCYKGYNINYKELFEKLPKDD